MTVRNPRQSWGTNEDETFIVGNGGTAYTTNFTNNKKLARISQTDTFIFDVEYTKGSETEIQVQLSFQLFNDPDNILFVESIVDVSNGNVSNFIYKFAVTGTYRIAIPISPNEIGVQLATRTTGASNGTTQAKFSFTTNNLRSR